MMACPTHDLVLHLRLGYFHAYKLVTFAF